MANKSPAQTITGRVYEIIFELLEQNPDGIQWSDLLKQVKQIDSKLHPKTVNGCVWKLLERYPNEVHKPAKGRFQLKKFAK